MSDQLVAAYITHNRQSAFGLYQACSSRLLLLGARGYQELKPVGNLAL
jgi:hypothetical protein